MENERLINVLDGIKNDLKAALAYSGSGKSHINKALGKVETLIELLKK